MSLVTYVTVSQQSFKPALKADMKGNKLKVIRQFAKTRSKVRRTSEGIVSDWNSLPWNDGFSRDCVNSIKN